MAAKTSKNSDSSTQARYIPVRAGLYPIFVAAFVAQFGIGKISASKGVTIGPLVTDGAFFLFPIAYVIGDVLAECYGFKATRVAIWTGFAAALGAVIAFYIAIWLPAADFYENQEAFSTVLGFVPQIVAASLAGYAVGQLLNAWVLTKMKSRNAAAPLWQRLMGSTVVGEFGDTLVFCLIAATAIGISTVPDFVNYVVVGFVWKTLMEAILLPVTYKVVAWVKQREMPSSTASSTA